MSLERDIDALDPFPLSVVRDRHGLPATLYHGTRAGAFERFREGGFRRGQQLGFGLHFAEDRAFADLYATGRNGRVLECLVDIRRPLDVAGFIKEGTEAHEFGRALFRGSRQARMWDMATLGGGTGDLWLNLDLFDARRVLRMLREHGFDGVRYKAKYGSLAFSGAGLGLAKTAECVSWVALDPDQVRVLGVVPAAEAAPGNRPGQP